MEPPPAAVKGRHPGNALQGFPEPAPSAIAAAADADSYLAELQSWAEREARAVEGGGTWLLDELAEDDRRHPPPRHDDGQAEPWDEQKPKDYGRATGESPDAGGGAALLSMRAVISTAGPQPLAPQRSPALLSAARRYLNAAVRVDQAHEIAEQLLRERATNTADSWSVAGHRRRVKLLARADATHSRRLKVRECITGKLCVPVLVCNRCGGTKLGGAMTCNSRCCPRCVGKLRRANQAKVHDLLQLVDERRSQVARLPARWRFLTLTLPSLAEFEPMRRWLGSCWGELLRTRLWRDRDPACVMALESTHTRAGWHVHLHASVDEFLPRLQLVRQWQRIAWRLVVKDAERDQRQLRTRGDRDDVQRALPLARTLRRLERCTPQTWEQLRDLVAWSQLRGATGDARREVRRCQRIVARLPQLCARVHTMTGAIDVRDLAADAVFAMHKRSDRRTRTVARWQLRRLLHLLPRDGAQDIRDATGTREQMVFELAKYSAKDLGGAAVESEGEWGVFGTPARGAEFLLGSFRWRTLRSYGDAYRAELREIKEPAECPCCSEPMQHLRTVLYSQAEFAVAVAIERKRMNQLRAPPKLRSLDQLRPEPRATVQVSPPPAHEHQAMPPGRLRDLVGFWRALGTVALSQLRS
jgi:hypothetical protein